MWKLYLMDVQVKQTRGNAWVGFSCPLASADYLVNYLVNDSTVVSLCCSQHLIPSVAIWCFSAAQHPGSNWSSHFGDLPSLSPDLCGTEVKTANPLSHISRILPLSLGLVPVALAKHPLVLCFSSVLPEGWAEVLWTSYSPSCGRFHPPCTHNVWASLSFITSTPKSTTQITLHNIFLWMVLLVCTSPGMKG